MGEWVNNMVQNGQTHTTSGPRPRVFLYLPSRRLMMFPASHTQLASQNYTGTQQSSPAETMHGFSAFEHSWTPFGALHQQASQASMRSCANPLPRVMPKMSTRKKRAATDDMDEKQVSKRLTLEEVGEPAKRTLLHIGNFNMMLQRSCPPAVLKSFKYDKQMADLVDTIAKDFHAMTAREHMMLAAQADVATSLSAALAEKAKLEQQVATLTLTQANLIAQLPAPPVAMAVEVPTLDQIVDQLPAPSPLKPEMPFEDYEINLEEMVKFLDDEIEKKASREPLEDITNSFLV